MSTYYPNRLPLIKVLNDISELIPRCNWRWLSKTGAAIPCVCLLLDERKANFWLSYLDTERLFNLI